MNLENFWWQALPADAVTLTLGENAFTFTAKEKVCVTFTIPPAAGLWRSKDGVYARPGERCSVTLAGGENLTFSLSGTGKP